MSKLGWSVVPLLLAGCSGEDSAALPIEGSYDLVFEAVEAPYSDPSVLLERPSRIDLREIPGGYEAVLTGPFAHPAAFQVAEQEDALLLSGLAKVYRPSGGTFSLLELTLELDDDELLAGHFSVSGRYVIRDGESSTDVEIDGTGSVTADQTAPASELRHRPVDSAPEHGVLPWDKLIDWYGSEAVAGETLPDHFELLRDGEPDALPMVLELDHAELDGAASWAGVSWAAGRLADWSPLVRGGSMQLSVDAELIDPSGNMGGAAQVAIEALDVGDVAIGRLFDDPNALVASWGGVTHLVEAGTDHPDCEQGGCLQIGPFDSWGCSGGPVGIAVALDTTAATSLRIRYRVQTESEPNANTPYPCAVRVVGNAADGSGSQERWQQACDVDSSAYASDGSQWSTDWLDLVVQLGNASAANQVGVVLHGAFGSVPCHPMGGGGPSVTLHVDRIEAR